MIRKAHCLFEQSGTFKNEFIKLGIPAEDYDILNDFGETDHVIDLFEEIRRGGQQKPCIFDDMSDDDLIMAFFPCTRFEAQIQLSMRGDAFGQDKWSEIDKVNYARRLEKERSEYYDLVSMLALIVLERNLKMVIENPYSTQHYLTKYFPIKPKWIDHDRRQRGDAYYKPTQYWFIGFDPSNNFVLEPITLPEKYLKEKSENTVTRSMITPQYARRFIQEFIL